MAGNERAGHDQDERGASSEDREAVQAMMERDFDALQDCPLGKTADAA